VQRLFVVTFLTETTVCS